jgi:hypothetical protein
VTGNKKPATEGVDVEIFGQSVFALERGNGKHFFHREPNPHLQYQTVSKPDENC